MIKFDAAPLDARLEVFEAIKDEIFRIKAAPANSPYTVVQSADNPEDFAKITNAVESVKRLNPTLLLLVGIGGSNMGTLAVVQAVLGTYHNHKKGIKFYCADTIDNDLDTDLIAIVEQELVRGGTVILCIVTKSGTTSETIINGALFLQLLKKHRPNAYHNKIVIITDDDSPLVMVASQNNYHLLTIPKHIGGRFSVFTAVGLFPLMLLGIEVRALCDGANDAAAECLNENLTMNNAFLSAATLHNAYEKGEYIHDIFVFTPDLFMFGNWYKQLIGESLGKKYNTAGEIVEVGITPTVSVGTTDLHSVAQLYLAGPRNRITTFVYRSQENNDLKLPDNELSLVIPGLSKHTVSKIKDALFQGVVKAYEIEERPYMLLDLKKGGAKELGYALMMKMIETLFLARLLEINCFDQPAVEIYKNEARKCMQQ